MKRSKIIIAAGAFVLSIAGFMSTKANKVFSGVTAGYFKPITGRVADFSASGVNSSNYTTVSNGHTVLLVTAANKIQIATLYTSSASNALPVYYH